eukprot:scaffold47602_cov76-Phaeocystis_antarctica.AAC.2
MPRAPLRRPGPALEVFVAHLSGDLLQLENELASQFQSSLSCRPLYSKATIRYHSPNALSCRVGGDTCCDNKNEDSFDACVVATADTVRGKPSALRNARASAIARITSRFIHKIEGRGGGDVIVPPFQRATYPATSL